MNIIRIIFNVFSEFFFAANAKHDLFEKLFNKLFINLTTTQPQAISALRVSL